MTIFSCPICNKQLEKYKKEYVCPDGHSYDIASEGYVHLLPPNRMHSKAPGDNKQMVAARRSFLEAGHYELFSDKLNELCLEIISQQTDSPVLLDAGCGEGYYTGRLCQALADTKSAVRCFGFDISKCAVKAAAKKYKNIDFAVGSIFSIPAADSCADILLDIFAPIVPEELARVVNPGGSMIIAVPGARHLFGLKEILYEKPYENEYKETEYPGFSFIKREAVCGHLSLTDSTTVQNLFAMTPYYWKTSVEGSTRLQHTSALKTEIEFDFLVYRKQ